MGQVNTEQVAVIIESTADAIAKAQPEVVQPATNYWWLLTLAIIPVVLGYWLNRRKK